MDLAPIPTFACCSQPCDGMPGLGPSLNEEESILASMHLSKKTKPTKQAQMTEWGNMTCPEP